MIPERYDEMEEIKTTERILKRMTDPEEQEKIKIKKEEEQEIKLQEKRLGL